MSSTTTLTATDKDLNASELLSQSVSSAGSPRRHSRFSRPFKQASQFFLTRRFSDALAAIKPLITPQSPQSGDIAETPSEETAAVASADRKWRIKIWSFYITLLNAILELGAEDGKKAIGTQEWNASVDKARSGSIWDQVVDVGYQGEETLVDAEVVLNLANLLLAQSPDQKRNQDYIETYLSVALDSGLDGADVRNSELGTSGSLQNQSRAHRQPQTLHHLEVQLQIIEIYALHVLPRNDEWQYAREFLRMNETLDEERREILFRALDDLENDGDEGSQDLGGENFPSKGFQLSPKPSISSTLARTDSNVTVIPASTSGVKTSPQDMREVKGVQSTTGAQKLRSVSPRPNEEAPPPQSRTSKATERIRQLPNSTRDLGQQSLCRQASSAYEFISRILSNTTAQLARNPAPLLRFILFLVVLAGTFGRADLRGKLRRAMNRSLGSIKQTLGMGFRASSI